MLGSEPLWERVKDCVAKSDGQEEILWTRRADRVRRLTMVEQMLLKETDRRIQIWARVRLAGQRPVDVASQYGFRDGSGVYRVVRRLEALKERDRSLRSKLKTLCTQASQFKLA